MRTIETPPRSLMQVYRSLPEGTLAELIDNNLIMSPAPQFIHQQIQKKITRALDQWVEDQGLGFVVPAPFDVFLDNTGNAVQPDITVILKGNPGKLDQSFFGTPDLIVEVLSPGNSHYDLVKKRDLYEKFGVKEYWVVDPLTKDVTGFFLQVARFIQLPSDQGKIESRLLGCQLVF
ncbi:MAG TPA: restriction endonuclease [Cytophagales bacterium]|nr:restriction endonuclease [Cytophagales bacterium]